MKQEAEDFCKKHGLTVEQFYGREMIDGSLDLRNLTSIPEGFNPTVGVSLDLSSLTSIPEGFNPTTCGSLYLSSLTSIPKGFNPTVVGGLHLSSLTNIPEGFNPTVGESLHLRRLTSIPEGFNPTVGGYLDLSSLTNIPEGFNPTVGGSLDLSCLTSIPEGFNPTVGGWLYLPKGLVSKHTQLPEDYVFSWQNGKYLKVDGIACEVLNKKGNLYRVKAFYGYKELYLLTDGNGKWAHGETLDEAKQDLLFKICERNKEDYKDLTLESELSFEDAIVCYRVITGACNLGTRDFIKNRLKEVKPNYSIEEMIVVTKGEYGNNSFKEYFK